MNESRLPLREATLTGARALRAVRSSPESRGCQDVRPWALLTPAAGCTPAPVSAARRAR